MQSVQRVLFCGIFFAAALFTWVGMTDSAVGQTFSELLSSSGDVTRPVFLTAPTGDSSRLFVAEQHTGRIKIFDRNAGNFLSTPFIDLTGLSSGNEQGLLGMAFDPDYANNGYFYVNVNTAADGGDTHIRRYQVTGDPATSNVADLGSEFEILSFNQPQSNHNGGWIGFGPNDGHLYIATGDGGSGNDSGTGHTSNIGNAQDLTNNLLGKVLRIDVHGDDFAGDANRNYAIPIDNPFTASAGDDEIWSYGLRNPYRASFDRATGDLWIGDVGQGKKEEVDYQPASSPGGENYGWRLREGTIQTPGGVGGPAPVDHVEPIFDYFQSSTDEPDPEFRGRSVIGGYVYRGPVEAFQGHYIFADVISNNIWKLDPEAIDPRASVQQINDQLLPDSGSISDIGSFGEDSDGNLYFAEVFSGGVYRVTTSSKKMIWNGDDATAGIAGDGSSWSNANNWTRDNTVDQSFVSEDPVTFAAGSSQTNVDLGADRTVAAVTFEAPFTLQNHTLRVLSGNVTVDAGATATIASDLIAETGNNSLRKLGDGTLLVEGMAGQMVVKAGTLGGNGTLDHLTAEAGGTVAPGDSVGTLTVTNTLTLESGSTLAIEIGGTDVVDYDQLVVGGTAALDGTLSVELVNGFIPQAGDSFGILAATGGAGGMFSTLDLPTLGPDLEWLLNPGGITVGLFVNSTLPGDFDNDGDVDGDDLATWQTNFGLQGGAGRSQGDADGDFDVDGADFLAWQRGAGSGSGTTPSNSSVPEPTSLLLLGLGLLFSVSTRSRRCN